MTPHRALIEAAEESLDRFPYSCQKGQSARCRCGDCVEVRLREAISSAKAAEESVETAWRMVNKHRPLGSGPMFETEAAARACFNMPYNHTNYPRLERLDTYTTVISVREKEGL